jgi:hypothetical protein
LFKGDQNDRFIFGFETDDERVLKALGHDLWVMELYCSTTPPYNLFQNSKPELFQSFTGLNHGLHHDHTAITRCGPSHRLRQNIRRSNHTKIFSDGGALPGHRKDKEVVWFFLNKL